MFPDSDELVDSIIGNGVEGADDIVIIEEGVDSKEEETVSENLLKKEEEVKEEPADCYISESKQHVTPLCRQNVCKPSEEELVDSAERDYSLSQIDSYGVQSYHPEEKCPFLPLPYINDIVEEGKLSEGISSNHKNERTCPQPFVDREHKTPDKSDNQHCCSGYSHVCGFPVA